MKQRVFIFLMTMLVALFSLNANAADVEVNGISYYLNTSNHTAEVAWKSTYAGDIVIPASIESDGVTYKVTSVGYLGFYLCNKVTSVIIGENVTKIGHGAFAFCSALASVSMPNSVTFIDKWAFQNCSSLTSVTIGRSVEKIEEGAFAGCKNLVSVDIPNSVTFIGTNAFEGCSMDFLILPNSIRTISTLAFQNCKKITDVYCYAENVPSTKADAFTNVPIEQATLHVPEESVGLYQADAVWGQFGKFVTLSGDEIEKPEKKKCETPAISYLNGKLLFSCDTEGAEFVSEITDEDIKKHYDNEVDLSVTYHVSVYATKTGFENSEIATATLCWVDQHPQTEGLADGVAEVKARAFLIKSNDGCLTMEGIDDGERVSVYTISGVQVGGAISKNGMAVVNTNLQKGEIAVIKVGEKSTKVLLK